MHGVWIVWASGGSTRGREYPSNIAAQEGRRSTIDGCGHIVELGAQDFFYDSRPDGLMRGIARLLPIGGALLIFSEYNVRLTSAMRGYKERDCSVLAAHYCQEAGWR